MSIRRNIGLWALAGLAALALPTASRAQAVVTVDRRVKTGVSRLRLGVTHTQVAWEGGDPAAVARARGLLRGRLPIQNQSIMGWGVGDPEPSPGQYDFAGLDRRVALMRSLGGERALTLCSAPGWMKVTGQEWDMNDRVAEAHVADFAALCRVIALRYPDVRYFDVWNEWKGYWGDPPAYTRLYNAVYTAVKAARPEAQVGGFYLPVAGDGSGARGYTAEGTQTPVTAGDIQALDYWLANKAGADFIAIDRWLVDWKNKNAVKPSDQLALTPLYGKVLETITARTTLPVWYAEYYTWRHNPGGTAFIACAEASLYFWMIHGAQGRPVTALIWNPSAGEEDVNDYLFTETKAPDGGKPTPHYAVVEGMHDRFPPGTALCRAASSDPSVEVLASPATTLLINKHDAAQRVTVNGKPYALAAYAVQFIRTPGPHPRPAAHPK